MTKKAFPKISLKKAYIILALLILAQLFRTTYVFACQKEGLHSDEIWSYGLANSYYQPFIYMKDGVFIDDSTLEDAINISEWVSGETFLNYITVQEGQQFSYDSVYHNQTLDHHPPLYYCLLHTVCSFFPNSFSVYYAYFLNCIFLIVTQIFLFKLLTCVTRSETSALLGCFLYGAGTGALETFIFLRQYTLLTMLTVMYTYFNARLYSSEDFNLKKWLPAVAITAFCSFMTHYYGIAYVGVFTACFCIYMLLRRKFKKMFIYGGTVLGTLLIYFAVYPACLKQFGYSNFDTKILDFKSQTLRLISYVTTYNLGIKVSMYKSAVPNIILAVVVTLFILSLPVFFLCRKEKWFADFKAFLKALPRRVLNYLKKANYIALFMAVAAFAVILLVSHLTDMLKMGDHVRRYYFAIFPIVCGAAVILVVAVLKRLPKIKKYANCFLALLVAFTVVRVNIIAPNDFLFEGFGEVQDTAELLEGKNCLLIVSDSASSWSLENFTMYFYKADSVFVSSGDTIADDIDTIGEKNIDYVLITSSCLELTDSETEYINSWYDEDTTEMENAVTFVGEMVGKEYSICNEYIESLNGGCYYDILYGININGGCYYILKLK